jgi:hypothetical protein
MVSTGARISTITTRNFSLKKIGGEMVRFFAGGLGADGFGK